MDENPHKPENEFAKVLASVDPVSPRAAEWAALFAWLQATGLEPAEIRRDIEVRLKLLAMRKSR